MVNTKRRIEEIAHIIEGRYDPFYIIPETIKVLYDGGGSGKITGLEADLRFDGRTLGRFTEKYSYEIAHLNKIESDVMGSQLRTMLIMYLVEEGRVEHLNGKRADDWFGEVTEQFVIVGSTSNFYGRIEPYELIRGRVSIAKEWLSKTGNHHLNIIYSLMGVHSSNVHDGTAHCTLLRNPLTT